MTAATQDYEALAGKLEKLDAAASPGPWEVQRYPGGPNRLRDASGYPIGDMWTRAGFVGDLGKCQEEAKHNPDLIVVTRNLVPFVVAALRSLAFLSPIFLENTWDDESWLVAGVRVHNALALARSLGEEGT